MQGCRSIVAHDEEMLPLKPECASLYKDLRRE